LFQSFKINRLTTLIVVVLISGCASVATLPPPSIVPPVLGPGIYHKVTPGETLFRISKLYNVTVDDLVKYNKIPNVAYIEKNQLIFIPNASKPLVSSQLTDISKNGGFDWPVKGRVVSYFGDQGSGRINNGIDIKTDFRDKVLAVHDGKVVFADHLSGYGQTVIVDHSDHLMSVYSQNSGLFVKVDDVVKKGSPIARVGRVKGIALLHFEIRKNAIATNPLYFLP